MRRADTNTLLPKLTLLVALFAAHPAWAASELDHREFEASLHVPFTAATAPGASEARTFTMAFDYPLVERAQDVSWRVELLNPAGDVVQRWHGVQRLFRKSVEVQVKWAGREDNISMPDGLYQVRMQAAAHDAAGKDVASKHSEQAVELALAAAGEELAEQSWEMALGRMATQPMPAFRALRTSTAASASPASPGSTSDHQVRLSAPALGSLPYTVYFGNLHSQTNHSDGGDDVATCSSGHAPQSGAFGPSDAYAYARNRGLDILLTSEHNHMYDGSSSTDTSASVAAARALFQSGLTAAADFNAANPDFLGVYGLEWGVINNGGHLNIFNTPELLQWEYNSSGQLIGDTLTEKGDYAGLYTLMRQRGWVGQFNHPKTTGQFLVNGVPLGYTSDGDQAMVLCEVLNTSAFSANTTETETGRSTFESACNKALESGFHVAFATNQDNHCANWGASYTNRTGVLIPNGVALTQTSFIDALKARRVFATMDKTSQLVLTANGRIMGERFTNSGPLNLIANFASSSGKTISSVSIVEGVPGRNGTVSQLSATANTTITPSIGEHFYYAKLTQSDGKILWSAPIWVTQTGSGDSEAPLVSAGATGTSGTISLAANASDNVAVTLVEFYIDSVFKASSNTAPYVVSIDSNTLSNGSHSLQARAYDAAGNVGASTALSFSVNNTTADTTAPTVSASQSGTSGVITLGATASDNVGVSQVEFYVDNALKGSDTSSPYSITLNSTTLSNGTHTLTAKAFDAAGNSKLSSPLTFSVNNVTSTQLIVNGSFESGGSSWTASSGVITSDAAQPARSGSWKAWLNGYGATHTDSVFQQLTIPSLVNGASLALWIKIETSETTTSSAYDQLKVQVRNTSNSVLATLASYSNLDKGTGYVQRTFDLSAYKGQTVRIYLLGTEDSSLQTSFMVDDITLTTQ
jgi:hypothetical protein